MYTVYYNTVIMISKDMYILLILHILVDHESYNTITLKLYFNPIIAMVLQLIITN